MEKKSNGSFILFLCSIIWIVSCILTSDYFIDSEPKPKTYCHKEIVIDINDGACDYSIFYSSEDAKIARKGVLISAYDEEMKFEYEGQEYIIKVKDVDKFIEFDNKKGE